jgi:hypothetical protein
MILETCRARFEEKTISRSGFPLRIYEIRPHNERPRRFSLKQITLDEMS